MQYKNELEDESLIKILRDMRRHFMGVFDFINDKLQKSQFERQEAEMNAEKWDMERICEELRRESKMTKCSGYIAVLRSKCKEAEEWKLKQVWDRAYESRNAKACSGMMPVMIERGLGEKDENGRFRKKY